jgi:hypothetical protein
MDYSKRSPQGENMLRTIYYDHPQWTPVLVGFLPACWLKHGEQLHDVLLAHPRLFPNHTKPEKYKPPQLEGLLAAGRVKDCWGCTWENLHPGIIGQVVGHPLANWSAWDTWKCPDPMTDALLGPRDWDDVKYWIDKHKADGHFVPTCVLSHGFHYLLLCDLCGFEKVMMDMLTGEPMLDKLVEAVIGYNAAATEKALDLGAEFYLLAEDLGTQKALPISLDLWRKYVKPGYEATAGQARDRGLPVFLHCDGNILSIIDDLKETGITILNPQARPNGLQGLKDHAKGKMAICLDLDRQLYPFAKPDELRAHVRDAYDALGGPEGGLMFNVEISEDVPFENLHALFSALEDICNLPDPEVSGHASIGF